MQQNSSHWLRRLREKHRRISEIIKHVHPVDVQMKQDNTLKKEKTFKKEMGGTNVIPIEQRKPSGARKSTASIAELEADVWELRKQFILQIAKKRNGKVKLQEVAAECNVNIRIAADWLIRLSMEGILSLVAGQRNTMTYLVKEAGGAKK